MKIANLTPREFAHESALDWIRNAFHGTTNDLGSLTDAERDAVQKALVKLHDHILTRSGLDGLPLSQRI